MMGAALDKKLCWELR